MFAEAWLLRGCSRREVSRNGRRAFLFRNALHIFQKRWPKGRRCMTPPSNESHLFLALSPLSLLIYFSRLTTEGIRIRFAADLMAARTISLRSMCACSTSISART